MPKKTKQSLSKIYPKLRMIANGSNEVNDIRSQSNNCIKSVVKPDHKQKNKWVLQSRNIVSPVHSLFPFEKVDHPLKENLDKKRLKEKDKPKKVMINVFMRLRGEVDFSKIMKRNRVKALNYRQNGSLVKAEIRIDDIYKLSDDDDILFIEGSQSIVMPPTKRFSLSNKKKPSKKGVTRARSRSQGADVLVGIIDVGGFDFSHPDFLDSNGKTRFVAIWDQGGDSRLSPADSYPVNEYLKGLDYGSVVTNTHIDTAIADSSTQGIPVYILEPQSQQNPSSHATHVASIAAGNTGVASKAEIIGVLISTDQNDDERRSTFTDSSRISDAVDFLLGIAKQQSKPISINISLGTNGHAHDGSSSVNRWIDTQLSQEGIALCVAAGNTGQEIGTEGNEFGYIFGRIHTEGIIEKTGLAVDIEVQVGLNNIKDISENEIEIWYEPQDRMSVMVQPPGMDWIGPVKPQSIIENQQLSNKSFISIYNQLFHPANGNNYIGIYLSPNFNRHTNKIEIPSGTWRIRLIGEEIRDGKFDAWIERDDPFRSSDGYWYFPSFFTEQSNVDRKSINSLACGHNVISVGNFDTATEQINISSSQGPTRDLRTKPEIIAPGTDIVAANGFTDSDNLWISKTGTSMASPYVCGVAALMLSNNAKLNSVQIAGILKRTSDPVVGQDYSWKDDTGFGVVNIEKAISQVDEFHNQLDITNTF